MRKGYSKGGGPYEIGKGRPPQPTQWKPGQSGNPSGRPRGAKSLKTLFFEALNQPVEIQEMGKRRTITAREGIVKKLINLALKGDLKAIVQLLEKEPDIMREAVRKNWGPGGMGSQLFEARMKKIIEDI